MNRAKLDCPLTPTATAPPLIGCRWTKLARAVWISASRLSPALERTVLVLDDVEVIDAEAVAVADELDRLEGAVPDVDAPGKRRSRRPCGFRRLP